MTTQACIDLATLEQYVHGETGEADASDHMMVAAHLDVCAECRARLVEVEANLRLAGPVHSVLLRTEAGAAPPDRIGPYTVRGELGRGGMGVVYLAEQEHPRRSVALKLIRPGADSVTLARRLEYEANVLAQLRHPGIAQVYDAGLAPVAGHEQPFFAMELIDGERIDTYAERCELSPRERLELLARTCDAVHHAHVKGVIHRDLKPGNIMVAPASGDDATDLGQPKVLDFGVARITGSDLETMSMHTDVGQLIGTVPFMSPEQVAGDAHDLDARSDVYALGVVGYVLLAGALPYDLERCSIPEAARLIQDEDPTRLGTIRTDLRGDVETIFLKALEKDRDRRYQSASALADDIRRYLRREPITAQPAGTWYQARRFAQRNPALVTALGTIGVVLIAATVVSLTLLARALRAEQDAGEQLVAANMERAAAETSAIAAKREAAKYEAVNLFLEDMLGSISPEEHPGEGDVTVASVLALAAGELDEGSLADQRAIELGVRTTIGNTYRALGDYPAAQPQLERAVAIGRELHPDGHADLAYAMNKLARVLESRGDLDAAEAVYVETLAMRERLLDAPHKDIAASLNNLAHLRHTRGAHAEAIALHERALAMRRELYGPEHEDVATSLNNLAVVHSAQGEFAEAERLLRASLEMDQRIRGELHPNIASTMSNLAIIVQNQNRLDEAEVLLRRVLELRRDIYDDQHPALANALNNLAVLLVNRGNWDEAEAMYREAIAIDVARRGPRSPSVATAKQNLGGVLRRAGRYGEADALLREAIDIRREVFGDTHRQTLIAIHGLGRNDLDRGDYEAAERGLGEAAAFARDAFPAGHWALGVFLRWHGVALVALARYPEAEAALTEAHAIGEALYGADGPRTKEIAAELAKLHEAWGEPAATAAP